MTTDLILVLALLGGTVIMFALNRPRMDAVALMMMAALPLTGVITVNEALAGFADPNVVLIALLFVIGESLVRTGIAQRLGDWLVARAGASEARLIVLLMIIVTGIGSVMSSTGVVALFIPIVLRIARNSGTAPARLMMPLSVAALISGMMTLVATPPNLVIHAELVRNGEPGFNFFAFTPFGIPMLALAIGYMLLARRWLGGRANAPAPVRATLASWVEEYQLAMREHRLLVTASSTLAGRTLADLDLRASAGVNLLVIERRERFGSTLIEPAASSRLEVGDVLLLDIVAETVDVDELASRYGLASMPLSGTYFSDLSQDIGMAEVMVPAASPLVGRTLLQTRFRSNFNLTVVGLKRGQTPHREALREEPLQIGDTLLVVGPWRAIRQLQGDNRQLVVIELPVEFSEVAPATGRAPQALAVLALVIALMASGIVPNVQAALIGCLLLGLFGCIDMTSAYRSIHWQSLILIVGMLPFSLALQKTGGIDLAVQTLLELVDGVGPRPALAALFTVTAVLGLFISNTATAVLMAPATLALATALGTSPYPFAMTVALAASASFMTPVSSPVNTLVVGPGGYTFLDFMRIGVPLTVMTGLLCTAVIPWLLPF